MQPHRKGLNKDFVDGAGLPSPGRWKVSARNLPDDDVARALRRELRDALRDMEVELPGGTLRKAMLRMAQGGLTQSPFPAQKVASLRERLRKVLGKFGFGEGRAQKGDAKQITDVRLLQALMKACKDPDHYFVD